MKKALTLKEAEKGRMKGPHPRSQKSGVATTVQIKGKTKILAAILFHLSLCGIVDCSFYLVFVFLNTLIFFYFS